MITFIQGILGFFFEKLVENKGTVIIQTVLASIIYILVKYDVRHAQSIWI